LRAIDTKLTAAMEDYIKVIMNLERDNKVARVSDISRKMNVKKASVVAAVTHLKSRNLASQEKYGFITLTEAGKFIASKLEKKYNTIMGIIGGILKVEPATAAAEACAMEHVVSQDTLDKLHALAKAAKKAEKLAVIKQKKPAKKKK